MHQPAIRLTTHLWSFPLGRQPPESGRSARFPTGRIAVILAALFRIVFAALEALRIIAPAGGQAGKTRKHSVNFGFPQEVYEKYRKFL